MGFDNEDTIDPNPVTVTTDSISIQWKEGEVINPITSPYIGYYLYYRINGSFTWTRCCNVIFDPTVEWQQGTIDKLEPDTEYEIDISVYRIHQSGQVYEETENTSQGIKTIVGRTAAGKFNPSYVNTSVNTFYNTS